MTGESAKGAHERSRMLDVLRAAAVLLVIGRHLPMAWEVPGAWASGIAAPLVRGGWMGVDLFFVLSGFLVSGLLFREHQRTGSLRIGRFLLRRGLKIYPPFYFLLAVTTVWLLAGGALPRPAFLRELFFFQNYGGGLWAHTWSLAVEEHFYLLLAAGAVFLARRGARGEGNDPFRAVPAVFAAIGVTCLALRIWVGLRHPRYDLLTHTAPTHLRIDALFFGVLLSYWRHFRPDFFHRVARHRAVLVTVGIACMAWPFLVPLHASVVGTGAGFTVLYLGAGMLLWALSERQVRPTAPARALAYLGARSYSIYLWHVPVAKLGSGVLAKVAPDAGQLAHAVFYVAGALAVGVFMNEVLEGPVLRLRERYFPGRAEAAPPAVPTHPPGRA